MFPPIKMLFLVYSSSPIFKKHRSKDPATYALVFASTEPYQKINRFTPINKASHVDTSRHKYKTHSRVHIKSASKELASNFQELTERDTKRWQRDTMELSLSLFSFQFHSVSLPPFCISLSQFLKI